MSRSAPGPEIRWDEYDHFAGFGWTHERIAARLGVNPHSLSVALARRAERKDKDARTEKAA